MELQLDPTLIEPLDVELFNIGAVLQRCDSFCIATLGF